MSKGSDVIQGTRAKNYDANNFLNGTGFVHNRVVRFIRLAPRQELLDVGCGSGSVLIDLAWKYPEANLHGIDPSADMIEQAKLKSIKARVRLNLKVGFGQNLDYLDGSFDWVISSLALHHMDLEEKQKLIKEAVRVLKPRGRLLMSDFGPPTNLITRLYSHILRRHSHSADNLDGRVWDLLKLGSLNLIDHQIQFGIVHYVLLEKN